MREEIPDWSLSSMWKRLNELEAKCARLEEKEVFLYDWECLIEARLDRIESPEKKETPKECSITKLIDKCLDDALASPAPEETPKDRCKHGVHGTDCYECNPLKDTPKECTYRTTSAAPEKTLEEIMYDTDQDRKGTAFYSEYAQASREYYIKKFDRVVRTYKGLQCDEFMNEVRKALFGDK